MASNFKELRKVVLEAVKSIQKADFDVQQALIEMDLTELADIEIEALIELADKSSQFRWEGLQKFSSEKYRRQAEDRKRQEREDEEREQRRLVTAGEDTDES